MLFAKPGRDEIRTKKRHGQRQRDMSVRKHRPSSEMETDVQRRAETGRDRHLARSRGTGRQSQKSQQRHRGTEQGQPGSGQLKPGQLSWRKTNTRGSDL